MFSSSEPCCEHESVFLVVVFFNSTDFLQFTTDLSSSDPVSQLLVHHISSAHLTNIHPTLVPSLFLNHVPDILHFFLLIPLVRNKHRRGGCLCGVTGSWSCWSCWSCREDWWIGYSRDLQVIRVLVRDNEWGRGKSGTALQFYISSSQKLYLQIKHYNL